MDRFVCGDTDSYHTEMSELYNYTEFSEFNLNLKAFKELIERFGLPSWQLISLDRRREIIQTLMNDLDLSDRTLRMSAARCILYLAQGCWDDVLCITEQIENARENILLLYECDVFVEFVRLLDLEVQNLASLKNTPSKVETLKKDSTDLQVILSVLYTITETIRFEKEKNSTEYQHVAESFTLELNTPYRDDLLAVKLFEILTQFCMWQNFLVKKILILLWKISLVSLGGAEKLQQLKNELRNAAGLFTSNEDTIQIANCMRVSSPPPSAGVITDLSDQALEEGEPKATCINGENENYRSQYYRLFYDNDHFSDDGNTAGGDGYAVQEEIKSRAHLWQPKVRQIDIDQYLIRAREKFFGYSLVDDSNTLVGLPEPVQEAIKTLMKHKYTSLADIQIKQESDIVRNPISRNEPSFVKVPAENLYEAMLPKLSEYMEALLQVMSAAAVPTKLSGKFTYGSSESDDSSESEIIDEPVKFVISAQRDNEIIVKAASAILLLYLKHFKINHIFQFECISKKLIAANCIQILSDIIKVHFREDITSLDSRPVMDFPWCVIGNIDGIGSPSTSRSWRKLFSAINCLRILNKLVKWKPIRILYLMMINQSPPILRDMLKIRNPVVQLYALKLLKMQVKYFDRKWRKSNMKIFSEIYAKVRHRFLDDWACFNATVPEQDAEAETYTLKCVERFHTRRYPHILLKLRKSDSNETIGADEASNSLACSEFQNIGIIDGKSSWDYSSDLTDEFKHYYEMWLEQEVFSTPTNWDEFLKESEL